ncbi:helix-turn-helix domain-containing protein [Microbacterium sp. ARD31]|uniref:TetR/AcrR family transcriptional regulator n=1 Tax=Microbacterium sp. ARD31 TaxID=2962576 RepID=UPI0028828C3A|nr:helix-turn-helix domain-containing protein [Microbacterium sp. ARD31]MDT0188635.1 helix-turn-helix domain-containing protein [Microbacterium sp. ARD31]
MDVSADSPRERRRSDTTRNLIRVARHFTAERGLAGFTVEELCSEAAVSRRTFFNYFSSKDDAVLGMPIERADAAAVAAFLSKTSDSVGLSPSLLTDLAALAEERWRALDIAPDTVSDLFRAVEKEPRLLGRMIELGFEGEQFDARLVEQRENLPSGDLRAQAAAQIVGALVRSAGAEFLRPGNEDSFVDIFERRIVAARELFDSQDALMGLPR